MWLRHRIRKTGGGRTLSETDQWLPPLPSRLFHSLCLCGCCVRGQWQRALGEACNSRCRPRKVCHATDTRQRGVLCLRPCGETWFSHGSQLLHRSATWGGFLMVLIGRVSPGAHPGVGDLVGTLQVRVRPFGSQ